MIVKKKLSWIRLIFAVRGSALARIFPRILVITAVAIAVTYVEEKYGLDEHYSLTLAPFTLIGLAVSIFLGFRNNAAYDRYWEGRKLWGGMVNVSRSFARQITTLVTLPEGESPSTELVRFHREMVRKTIAYVHALRHHLRGTDPRSVISQFLKDDELEALKTQKNQPVYILRLMGERLHWAWKKGWIESYHLAVLEKSLTTMTDIQGGCERIKNTPIPFAYTLLTHRIVAGYCFALPFGLVKTVGVLTPVVVLMVSHAFFGLDDIGDEIEDPFGLEPQHLPLTTICRTIEVNLLQHIDEPKVPELLTPIDDILL